MRAIPVSIRLALLLGSAPVLQATQAPKAAPEGASEEASYVDPYDSMTAPLGGKDDAIPLPLGHVFLEPPHEPAAPGLNVPPVEMDEGQFEASVHFVQHGEDVWMRGPAFKACASKSGFTFIPFLGSQAPRSYPVKFQLEAATLGTRALVLDPEASVRREGQRFVLDRGPVDVIYEVGGRQVEQLFALDVAGAVGDLVLDVRVKSDLIGTPRGSGFRFEGPSGGMDYGAATVVDGAGRTARIQTVLEEGHLRLTVPAEFLIAAEGQVVIDPILTSFEVDGTSRDQREVDVAYDQSTDTYTYVYEDTFSGNDADIYRRTRTSSGALINGGLIFGNDQIWRDPAIGNLNGENVHLVVASVTNSSGNQEIRGRTYAISSNSLGGERLIGDTGGQGFNNIRPDVGGNSRAQPGAVFMVVWERSLSPTKRSVRIRAVAGDGTMGTLFSLDDANGVFQEEVSISQSAGDPQSVNVWNIVWRNEHLGQDTDSIRGAQLTTNVFLASPANEIYRVAPGRRLREIDVSDGLSQGGGTSAYLATYDNYVNSTDEATLILILDNALGRKHSLADLEHARPELRQDVRVGTTSDRFIVTYVDEANGDVYATVLQPIGQTQFGVAERRVLLGSTASANRGGAAIATKAAGGELSGESGIGWTTIESTGDFGANGVSYSATTQEVAGYHFCVGRPNSTGDYGFLSMFGTPSAAETKIVTASGLPPNRFALLLVGNLRVDIPMIGGSEGTLCLGGQFGRYTGQINSSGAAGVVSFLMDPSAIPAPFGTDAAVAGERFYWQAWHRDVVTGSATSNLTNAVAVTFE